MYSRRFWFLVVTFVLLGSWAQSALWSPVIAADAAQQTQVLREAPTWVLDGTDLVELNELRSAELPPILQGTYRAEQGGAMVSLSIIAESGDRWIVKRIYEEPELEPEIKEYVAERRGAALTGIDDDLAIQGTAEGLLVFELNSGTDSIPPDYWVHYLRLQ